MYLEYGLPSHHLWPPHLGRGQWKPLTDTSMQFKGLCRLIIDIDRYHNILDKILTMWIKESCIYYFTLSWNTCFVKIMFKENWILSCLLCLVDWFTCYMNIIKNIFKGNENSMVAIDCLHHNWLKSPLQCFGKDFISSVEYSIWLPICQFQPIPFLEQKHDDVTCNTIWEPCPC